MPNLSAREMLSQLPLRMATGGEASEALRRAQQAGDQGVQDYYANLRNLAESYIANADAPTGADAYNLMVESGISTTDLINAGVGQQALDKIFTLTEDPTVTTFKTPSSMESAFLRDPVLAAEAAARAARGEDGVASLQAQARDYVSGLMEDGITDAERAEAQRIATERGITFQDFVNTGVDPTLLFKTPTPKEEVAPPPVLPALPVTPTTPSGGAGLGTDIGDINKAIADGTALPAIPSGGAGAAASNPFPDVTAQNPVTPTTVYDPAAFAAANAGADIYAKGQPALDTQFRDSAPRTAIPNMPGQYDYTPAAKLLSATGSGYSFTPPSVTSRRRSLLSPLAIQQAGGMTSASQRFARDRQTIGNFLRGRLGSSKYGNTAAFNQFRNRLMSGEFGDVRQAMADGSLFDVDSDINRRFNAAYTKYESDMDSAAPRSSMGTFSSPTAAAGSIAPIDMSRDDPDSGLQEAAYAGAGDTSYYGAINPIDLRYGYAGFADGGLASLKKDEAEAAILASLAQGPSDTDQTESATMLQNLFAGTRKDLTPDDPLFITETVKEEVNPDMVKRDIPRMEWDDVVRPTPMRPETESKSMLENIISGAGKIPDSVGNYFVRPDETGGPSLVSPRQVGSDLVSMGGAIVDAVKEDDSFLKSRSIAEIAPVTGEIISGTDAVKFSGLANESRAAGDTKAADLYEQLVTLSAAGAVPLVGMGARLSRRATIKAVEEAIKKGALGDAAKMLEEIKAIDAWHGSPHKFKKFRSDKIGTGEGAQMYGSGIYLADASDVAKTYQPRSFEAEELMMDKYKAAERAEDYETMEIWESAMMHETPAEIIKSYSSSDYSDSMRQKAAKVAEELKEMPTEGGLYNVALGTTAENLLDWDAPLSKQSEAIQNFAAEEFTRELGMPRNHENWDGTVALNKEQLDSRTGATLYNSLTNRLLREGDYSSDEQAKAAASSYLNEIAEIDGIQYLDQASRDAGEGTRNYVVFDENLITIKPDDFATESAKMLADLDKAGSPDFIKTVDQIASSTGTPSVRKSTETGVPFVSFTEEYAAQVARTLPEPTNSKGYPGADVANLRGVKGDPIAETWNRQIANDPMGMLELYKKHPETDGGKVHDTDVFRELNPNYLADRTIATSVHEPSGALNNMFYEMKLAETQGQPGKWLFTGGGPASGKSSGLAGEMRKGADLVYDGSMANYDSVTPRIDAALASGKQVEVAFVLRDPEKAIVQAVGRAMKQKKEFGSGRTIPINYYAGMHVDARQTLKRLNERYADNEAFRVTVTSNQGGLDDIRQGTLDEVVDLDYDTTVRKVSSVLDEMKKEGVIDEDIYQGFTRNTNLETPTTPTSVSDTGGTPKRRGDGQAADQSDSQLGQERVQVPVNALEVGVDETLSGGQRLRNYTPNNLQTLEELASNASAGTKRADALINAPVETGTKVGIRLNLNSKIPNAPKGLDKLQTLHKNNFNGEALSYVPYATVENVVFNVSQKGRRGIAAKISGMDVPEAKAKFPAMSVDGNYVPDKNVLKEGGDFVEIGFNPKAHHLFIDMNTGQAVKGADLATVVGDRVYAKGVQYYKKSEAPAPLSASDGTDLPSQVRYQQMKSGGLVERATHNQTYI